MNENESLTTNSGELELMDPATSATELISRAEIDCQIATAHKFPRSMVKFKARAIEMATLDEETAASCLYSRPVGGGKFAEGLSIRTAEIVGACYGNLRVSAMIIEQTERYVKCRGMAHDLESNFASACEVIESTVKKDGTPYDERMRIVIAKACLSKARRDATFQVVPKALCKPVETAARKVAVGDASTISMRRDGVMSWISKLGIDSARVFKALGVEGVEEIGLEQLTELTGIKTAIKDGEVQVDEAFPPIPKKADLTGAGATVQVKPLTPKNPPPAATKPAAKQTPAPAPVTAPTTPALTIVPKAPEPEPPVGQAAAESDATAEAAAGLAPETEPEPEPAQAPEPSPEPEPQPEVSNEPETVRQVRLLMAKTGVTEKQVIGFCVSKKIAKPEQATLLDLAKSPGKLENVIRAWNNIAPGIKAIPA